jgi:serine/threonine-protein kinase
MASASIPAQPGETIAGKYQIERVLGTGGVGMVVAARHLTLGQIVAIKFLLPNAAHDQNDVRRFLREAQSAVQLKNEHVARVIDVGELDDRSPYIVLEYLDGQDLGATLRMSGPLPTVEAVGYLLQVCEAVAEAHSIGMVHRDLKPSNFFLTFHRDGSPLVKVLDFGIAKYKIEFEQQDVSLTQTRALLGSPVYMSPEQVRSARSVDPRSDIWSLGVSLFELLTDTVPFGGETVTGVAAAVATDPVPPIARYRPDVSPSLAAVIEKCLSKRPDGRYQSIAELAEALVPFGPPEAALSLQRISGVLGLKRQTANTDLRDSARNAVIASGEQLTQVAGQVPTLRRARPSTKRWAVGLFLLGLLGLVIVLLAKRMPLSIQAGAAADSTLRASTETLPKLAQPAVVAQQDPAQQEAAADPSKSPSVVASVEVRLAPQAPSRPATVAATHKQITQGQVPRVGASKAQVTKSYKKPTEGGSLEDIVDTRH